MSARPRRAWHILIRALAVAALAVVALFALLFLSLGRPSDREVELLAGALDIRAGSTVGEIGAGDGWMTARVAGLVGASGRVYSTELDATRLDEIRAAAREAGLSNVTVIQAAAESTNLPPACCDAIVMRRVYHHLENASPIVADIERALKPGGRLAIIDFRSSGVLGTVTREGIDATDLIAHVTGRGLALVAVEEWPGLDHYVAVFRKAAP